VKRATSIGLILALPANCASKQSALYTALREAIVRGGIAPNRRLPSTREFARAHGVSRGTAVIVYELLQAEGYLVTRPGAGTFVASSLPDARLVVHAVGDPPRPTAPRRPGGEERPRLAVPFVPYLPALDEFPIALWARLTAKHARLVKPDLLGHGHAAGLPQLRRAIAAYLSSTRGIDCRPEQIVLTSGTQPALLRCARLLTERGDGALIEDPGNPSAFAALHSAGLAVTPVPVDAQGIQIGADSRFERRPRLIYVTPAHQRPTGVVMAEERRRALLDWAAAHEAWIFEDDDESEFRYHGHPVPALYAADRAGRVLHGGSFDKTLFPALCIGYIVVPPALVDAFARANALYGRNPPILSQLVLCDFIESGHFVRHVRRMGECYRERRAALVEGLKQRLDGCVDIPHQPCGLELAVRWTAERVARAVTAASGAGLVQVEPISPFDAGSPASARQPAAGVLGFAAYTASALREAVERLGRAVDDLASGRLPVAERAAPAAGTRPGLRALQQVALAPYRRPIAAAGSYEGG
jgi:GntR family transcriptional regulator/MocR family aminotransferase